MTAALAWTRARPIGSLLATGLGAAALARYGFTAEGLIAAFTCGVLVVLSVIDIASHRLPNKIVLPSAAIVLVARLATEPEHWQAWLGAGLGAFAFFLVFALIYPAGLGMGDVKLALLLGFALGGAVLPALMVGTLAGAAAGIVLLARNGTQARRRAIPYGPFLAFGAIAILLLSAP
jgi:leader peptidase (prepilin peptidase) / N-methyltransferase